MILREAILQTLAYSDVFDYPLKRDELHRYLSTRVSLSDLDDALRMMPEVESRGGYDFLRGRAHLVALRNARWLGTRRSHARARMFGRVLGSLPFIRMVALSGSLAVRNCEADCDYDYLLVAAAGRVWIARAFALALNRIARLTRETICPNVIISERRLTWTPQDVFAAREFSQMEVIAGLETYARMRSANLWVGKFFPNLDLEPVAARASASSFWQTLLERPLRGRLGSRLEAWEMNRKIPRLTAQGARDDEARFSAEMCQGNFNQHARHTMERYHARLDSLNQQLVEI